MAALERKESDRDKRDKRDKLGFVPNPPGFTGAVSEGQTGHPPFRDVPFVPPVPNPSKKSGSLLVFASEEEAADFEERAAIREYEGGLSRAAAERLAWIDIQDMRASRPSPSQKAA